MDRTSAPCRVKGARREHEVCDRYRGAVENRPTKIGLLVGMLISRRQSSAERNTTGGRQKFVTVAFQTRHPVFAAMKSEIRSMAREASGRNQANWNPWGTSGHISTSTSTPAA